MLTHDDVLRRYNDLYADYVTTIGEIERLNEVLGAKKTLATRLDGALAEVSRLVKESAESGCSDPKPSDEEKKPEEALCGLACAD